MSSEELRIRVSIALGIILTVITILCFQSLMWAFLPFPVIVAAVYAFIVHTFLEVVANFRG